MFQFPQFYAISIDMDIEQCLTVTNQSRQQRPTKTCLDLHLFLASYLLLLTDQFHI